MFLTTVSMVSNSFQSTCLIPVRCTLESVILGNFPTSIDYYLDDSGRIVRDSEK